MIFDTDIFIWTQRGSRKAARKIQESDIRYLSVQSYMELLQGAENKQQHEYIKMFLLDFNFQILPFTENIGHRAAIYIEEYALSSSIRAGDAIIAATAVEHDLQLVTSNVKHFKDIKKLRLMRFVP